VKNAKGAEAYPLSWPAGWMRTRNRQKSQFRTGFGNARNFLFLELERLGAKNIVLSTNIPLRNDGLPRANMAPLGGDPGVAVYFRRKDRDMVFACDKYATPTDNIHAIAKTIEAMRGIERWGASDMMERAFSGFKQLEATNPTEAWWDVLECLPTADVETIQRQFRARLRGAHPDTGGSAEALARLTDARDQGLAAVRGRTA